MDSYKLQVFFGHFFVFKLYCLSGDAQAPKFSSYRLTERRPAAYMKKNNRAATNADRKITRRPVDDLEQNNEQQTPAAKTRRNPRLFERVLTAEELADGIEAYFKKCEETGPKPTKPGVCSFLKISTSTWDNWLRYAKENDGAGLSRVTRDKYSEYGWPIRDAQQRMSDELQQRTDQMATFLLRQEFYGGYTDRSERSSGGGNLSLNITFGETHKNKARNFGK
jgi:hypothetical protein